MTKERIDTKELRKRMEWWCTNEVIADSKAFVTDLIDTIDALRARIFVLAEEVNEEGGQWFYNTEKSKHDDAKCPFCNTEYKCKEGCPK